LGQFINTLNCANYNLYTLGLEPRNPTTKYHRKDTRTTGNYSMVLLLAVDIIGMVVDALNCRNLQSLMLQPKNPATK